MHKSNPSFYSHNPYQAARSADRTGGNPNTTAPSLFPPPPMAYIPPPMYPGYPGYPGQILYGGFDFTPNFVAPSRGILPPPVYGSVQGPQAVMRAHYPPQAGILPVPALDTQLRRKRGPDEAPLGGDLLSVQELYADFKGIMSDHQRMGFNDWQRHALCIKAEGVAQTMLYVMSRNLQSGMRDWCFRQRPSQGISNLVYALAKLREHHFIQLSQDDYVCFFEFAAKLVDYIQGSSKPAQEISNTLYAVGLMVQGGVIQVLPENVIGALSNLLMELNARIATSDKPTQEIANSLYAFGLMVHGGVIQVLPDDELGALSNLLMGLNARIATDDKPTQAITNSLYAFGLMVQGGVIQVLPENVIDALSNLLMELNARIATSDKPTHAIANSLYAFGLMVQGGVIQVLPENVIGALSNLLMGLNARIATSHKPTQEIANSLYAFGLMVQGGVIQVLPDDVLGALSNLLMGLSARIATSDKPTQEIANSLYAFGLMVQGDVIQVLPENVIGALSNLLMELNARIATSDKPTQEIANSLYAFGLMVQGGVIQVLPENVIGALSNFLMGLSAHIATSDKPTQHIANSLYAFGLMAQGGVIQVLPDDVLGALSNLLMELNARIATSDKPTQEIANSLDAFGLMVQQGVMRSISKSFQSCITALALTYCDCLHKARLPIHEMLILLNTLMILSEEESYSKDEIKQILQALVHSWPQYTEKRHQARPWELAQCFRLFHRLHQKGMGFEYQAFLLLLAINYLPEKDNCLMRAEHSRMIKEALGYFGLAAPERFNQVMSAHEVFDESRAKILQSLLDMLSFLGLDYVQSQEEGGLVIQVCDEAEFERSPSIIICDAAPSQQEEEGRFKYSIHAGEANCNLDKTLKGTLGFLDASRKQSKPGEVRIPFSIQFERHSRDTFQIKLWCDVPLENVLEHTPIQASGRVGFFKTVTPLAQMGSGLAFCPFKFD